MEDQTFLQSMTIAGRCMPIQHPSPDSDPAKLKESCSELESLFIYHLLKEMRASVPKSGLLGEGKTEETYTAIMDLELSKEIARDRGIGIASAIFDKLYTPAETCDKEAENNEQDQEVKELPTQADSDLEF